MTRTEVSAAGAPDCVPSMLLPCPTFGEAAAIDLEAHLVPRPSLLRQPRPDGQVRSRPHAAAGMCEVDAPGGPPDG